MAKYEVEHTEHQRDGIFQLMREIFRDAKSLSTKELLAAKLEIKQEIAEAKQVGISLAVGGFLLATGVVLLSLMVVFLLVSYAGLPGWAAFGLVGAAYALAGALMLWSGKRKAADIEPFPKESVENARDDLRYLKERAARHA